MVALNAGMEPTANWDNFVDVGTEVDFAPAGAGTTAAGVDLGAGVALLLIGGSARAERPSEKLDG